MNVVFDGSRAATFDDSLASLRPLGTLAYFGPVLGAPPPINISVVPVTGASSGMGKDIALRLIQEGYLVYGGARRVDRMADIEAAGGTAIALDVTDDGSAATAIDRILRERSRIDVLINAAGYGQYGALEDVSMADGRRQLETNLIGPARLVQLCLPHMRARASGKIVNISSIGGKFALPLGAGTMPRNSPWKAIRTRSATRFGNSASTSS